MNWQLPEHALETAFTWTWQISLRATVVIAFVLLVQLAFRKILTPRWSYALGLLMLLRLLLPFAPASPMSIFNLGSRFASRPAVQLKTPSVSPMPPPAIPADFAPAIIAAPATPPSIVSRAAPISKPHPKTVLNYHLIAAGLWLAGCVGMLALVARQHRRFVLALRRWEPVTEPRVLGLLGDCMAALGVKGRVTLLAATGPGTPALFGIVNPRLLIPADMLCGLDDRELRHIFLHELIHLRHGDVLLNWVMILVRSLHWFNPAVWLAMKKLRADQELACDAAVMARLATDERRQYGGTLLKLLGDFSATRLSPGFVPFITNKRTIKRRIIMISKFKPAGRLAVAGSLALLIALGCFTFTRAAEQAKTAAQPSEEPSFLVAIGRDGTIRTGDGATMASLDQLKRALRVEFDKDSRLHLFIWADHNAPADPLQKVVAAAEEMKLQSITLAGTLGQTAELSKSGSLPKVKTGAQAADQSDTAGNLDWARRAESFQRAMTNYENQIRDQQQVVDELRQELRVVDTDPQASSPAPALSVVSITTLQNIKIEAEIQSAGLREKLSQLKKLQPDQLRQALPTVVPDQILNTLLQDKNAAESTLAKQLVSLGATNPDVQIIKALIQKLDSQIEERVQGILASMQLNLDSEMQKVKEIDERLDSAKQKDLENVVRTRPYFIAKAKLEELKRFEEVLFFRAGQENMNLKMPTNESPIFKF